MIITAMFKKQAQISCTESVLFIMVMTQWPKLWNHMQIAMLQKKLRGHLFSQSVVSKSPIIYKLSDEESDSKEDKENNFQGIRFLSSIFIWLLSVWSCFDNSAAVGAKSKALQATKEKCVEAVAYGSKPTKILELVREEA